MNVVAFCGWSGAGKTTLVEQIIPRLKQRGLRVSVIKHAHHGFDVDREGKDSWRHRKAGAYEVLVASDLRMAKFREYEAQGEPTVHELIGELSGCDWVLIEGYKHSALPKIEVWRAAGGKPLRDVDDPQLMAVATDSPAALPTALALPALDLNDPDAVTLHLLEKPDRYEYQRP